MDPSMWNSCENTILRLEKMAEDLTDSDHYLRSIPVYVLWDVLTKSMLRPTIPSMSRHCRALYLAAHQKMNLNADPQLVSSLPLLLRDESSADGTTTDTTAIDPSTTTNIGLSPVPTSKELAMYEEEVVQREQMVVHSPSVDGAAGAESVGKGEGGIIFLLEKDKLQVHRVWLSTARHSVVVSGDIGRARLLLAEAERHSIAFGDYHAVAEIHELRCLIALEEVKFHFLFLKYFSFF